MGKRQHQKDKLYLTCTEWTTLYGGKQAAPEKDELKYRRLPFDHCCLTLQPIDIPYCDPDGNIFELEPIVAYIKKFKKNPVTGAPLEAKDLIKLVFHKNNEGQYHCPVLFKTFTKQTHIAAVKTTGNVFSYEAIEELNFKTKNWKDLLNSEPFTKKDVIILQDPNDISKFNIAKFHHILHDLKLQDEEERDEGILKTVNSETKEVLKELESTYKEPEKEGKKNDTPKPKADKFNAAHFSTGKVAAGLTSTVMTPELVVEPAIRDEDEVIYDRVKKKGYVRLVTNMGHLNLELHCDLVPKACDNFIKLCQQGYYNGTKFHRSIRHFMIQGGDPTGTGAGGKSIWGVPFEDCFKQNLTHTGRGILSMANSGPNTNQSQFFITYRSCNHLDKKHTVFGRLVGGMKTLAALEEIETDNKDRPIEDLIIFKAQVFVDPFQRAADELAQEREEERLKEENEKRKVQEAAEKKKAEPLKVYREGVGKYINFAALRDNEPGPSEPKKKKRATGYVFKDFKDW